MKKKHSQYNLSESQEKYLRTIYKLEQQGQTARVKDIAEIRDVKPGSVSPAMRNLAKLGLINYVRREFIELTPEGLQIAAKIEHKITLLTSFFSNVLNLSDKDALEQTCAVEHSFSTDTLFGLEQLVQKAAVDPSLLTVENAAFYKSEQTVPKISISEMDEGAKGIIALIKAKGKLARQIKSIGVLPKKGIVKNKKLKNGCVIDINGDEFFLNQEQADAIKVELSSSK